MFGLLALVVSFAHAQSPYATGSLAATPGGLTGCAYINGGRFESFPQPGCTIKRMSPSGDAVTFQVKTSVYGPDGKPTPVEKTFGQILRKENGRVTGVTYFEGDDEKKAAVSATNVLSPDAPLGNSNLRQVRVEQRENGKASKFLVYDRNLCARFKEAGLNLAQGAEAMAMCSATVGTYEDAAAEWSRQLKKEGTDLGIVAGYSQRGNVYRPVRTGALNDLMQLVLACQQWNPDVISTYPAAPAEAPVLTPRPYDRNPDLRPAAAKSSL